MTTYFANLTKAETRRCWWTMQECSSSSAAKLDLQAFQRVRWTAATHTVGFLTADLEHEFLRDEDHGKGKTYQPSKFFVRACSETELLSCGRRWGREWGVSRSNTFSMAIRVCRLATTSFCNWRAPLHALHAFPQSRCDRRSELASFLGMILRVACR